MSDLSKIIEELKKENIFIINCLEIKGGFNSNTFQLIDNKGEKFFLKNFIFDSVNSHKRIRSEVFFSKYLIKQNINNIPRVISHNMKSRWILFQWINGKKIKIINRANVENLIEFLMKINENSNSEVKNELPKACEFSFSLTEQKNLITSKISESISLINKINYIKPIIKFSIIDELNNKKIFLDNLLKREEFNNKDFLNYRLNINQTCISPSDVGFHNIIYTNYNLYFFDFEFAGIDDPCKLISDLVLQPDYGIPLEFIDLLIIDENKLTPT